MHEHVLVVKLRVKPGHEDAFLAEAIANARAALDSEPGCRRFDVVVDVADPRSILLFEVYDDAAAFAAHEKTQHFARYLEKALPHLESRERCVYRRVAP